MEHRQLRTFVAVARSLSFTRAATELGYVQSSVTAHVKALEGDLGVPLFDRLGRRVVLTDAGSALLGYAEKMLSLSEEARATVAGMGEPTGVLTVSAPETLWAYRLPRLLRRFKERFPGVRLALRPMACADLKAGVADGSVDVAFLLEGPARAPALEVEALVEEPLLVLGPPDHALALDGGVGPADLAGERIILTETGCSYRHLFERRLAEAGVGFADALELDSVEAIKRCVSAGMGVAVLPAVTVTAELERGEVVALAWEGPELGVLTQMAWHKSKWLSPALEAFLGLSRDMFGAGDFHRAGGPGR